MKRLVLIDGNAILYRAYYAIPETLTLKDGSPVNAVYGFTLMLLKTIQDLNPTYLICAFDLPKPTFRDEIYKDYRAQRPPTPDKLVAQVGLVKEVVRAFGIPIYEEEGFEADDVIGSLAFQATSLKLKTQNSKLKTTTQKSKLSQTKKLSEKNSLPITHYPLLEVIIVTGDRDLLQLVNRKVRCYMPVKGLSQAKLFGKKEVEEKYGINPEQLVDYKALVGDPSDNYPGVRGVGPKTARKLLGKFGNLEAVYEALEKGDVEDMDSKAAKALEKYKQDALMAKKLAEIRTDVPVQLGLEKAELGKLANEKVEKLFAKLKFKTLWGRVGKIQNAKGKRQNYNSKLKNESKKLEVKNSAENKEQKRTDQLSML